MVCFACCGCSLQPVLFVFAHLQDLCPEDRGHPAAPAAWLVSSYPFPLLFPFFPFLFSSLLFSSLLFSSLLFSSLLFFALLFSSLLFFRFLFSLFFLSLSVVLSFVLCFFVRAFVAGMFLQFVCAFVCSCGCLWVVGGWWWVVGGWRLVVGGWWLSVPRDLMRQSWPLPCAPNTALPWHLCVAEHQARRTQRRAKFL